MASKSTCLLPQPHGFEGFGRLSEVAKFGHRPVANRNNTGSRGGDLKAAHAPASALPARDQHVLIKISRPFDLKSPVRPTLAHVAEELEHAVCSHVAHRFANGTHEVHLESSITHRIEGLWVSPIHRGDATEHDLHVLLRHRLLPQPHGFEGFGAVVEDLGATDLSVLDVPDARGPHGGLDALCASGCDEEEGQNAPLYGSYLLDLQPARVREAPQLAKVVAYALVPGDRPLTPLKCQGEGHEFDLRRGHFQVRLDIAAIERRECPPHHLYVLLRHRPPSIAPSTKLGGTAWVRKRGFVGVP